jgi:hypothetical protein
MTALLNTGRGAGKRLLRGVPSQPPVPAAVTVVIPAYNYARYLEECVTSVLTQPHVEVRVLIVDDCSTDDTPAVTARLAARDPRITVIRNDPNRGHVPSVNRGLALVETEYVVKLDADDLLAPGALARATALLEAEPAVSFVYGRPRHFSGAPPAPRRAPRLSWTVWQGRAWMAQLCRSGNNAISQPEVVMRTAHLRAAGSVNEELAHTSDLNLWLRLSSRGDVGRINGPVQGLYRVHDQSMQRTVHAGQLFGLRGRRDAFDAALADGAGRRSGASALHDTARRSLAAEALSRACHAYDRGYTADPGEPVEEFIDFALETWPAATGLPQWEALARRQAVGAARAPHRPEFFAAAVARRATAELGRRRWLRTGEL